jgi:hypothetical protein
VPAVVAFVERPSSAIPVSVNAEAVRDAPWWYWPIGMAAAFCVLALLSFRNPSHYSTADVAVLTTPPHAACSFATNGTLLRAGSNRPCRPDESGGGVIVLGVLAGGLLGGAVGGTLQRSDARRRPEAPAR